MCHQISEVESLKLLHATAAAPVARTACVARGLCCMFGVLVLLTAVSGCQTLQSLGLSSDQPTASISAMRFDDLSLDHAGLVFDVKVNNPYSVALPLANIGYGVSTDGASVVKGVAKLSDSIPARGSKVVSLPVNLVFADLYKASSTIKAGQVVPYQADLSLSVDAPVVGEISLPMSKKGKLPVPAVPQVSLTSVNFDSLSFTGASATLKVAVKNTNAFAIDLNKMNYDLKLAGNAIASSAISNTGSFAPGQSRTLEIPITFSPAKLGTSAWSMLRGSGSDFQLAGDLQLGTAYGDLNLPYNQSGKTVFNR